MLKKYYFDTTNLDTNHATLWNGFLVCDLNATNILKSAGYALDALDLTQAIPEAHYLLGVSLAWYGDDEGAKQSLGFAAAYDKAWPLTPLFQLAIARKEGNNSEAELYKRK